ncbi:MAG: hypothetical protein NZ890_10080 [Myxococcota bacterium]|nr:hypothetical protein [Myxococcota bacterium]
MMTLLRPLPVVLLCACGLLGCAEEERGMYRGRPVDGGLEPTGDGGGGAPDLLLNPDLAMNRQGPAIQILEPAMGSLIKTPRVNVVAQVTRGGGTEVTTVQTRVAGQMKTVPMSLRAGSANLYEGELDLSALRSGPIGILVDASNTNMISNTAQVTATYDAGPVLTVREPSGLSYRGSAPVVIEARGDSGIQGGGLKSLKASVQGVDIMLTLDKASAFLWTGTGTVAFQDRAFPVPLSGIQVLRAEATNLNDVTVSLERPFTIDEEGPDIEFVFPKPGQIVGGVITMTVKVTDESGVNDTSVVAVWLNDPGRFSVALTRVPGTDNFSARFDTRRLPEPRSLIYPSLSYRARDRLGNQSSRGEVLILDNTPPIMALDPPLTQVRTRDTNLATGFKCSIAFNPLGTHPALLKDGAVLGQVVTARARVTERGNIAPGLAIEHTSGIDPNSVDLLATPLVLGGAMPSPPLVVDADGKGICNNLNPLLQPTSAMTASNQALVLRLSNITVTGQPSYGDDPLPFWPRACTKPGDSTHADGLCSLLDYTEPPPGFTYAIPGEIWTIGPVTNRECAGLQLDSLNVLPEGPYCVAVRAADNAGNRNVSKPLRVCIERPVGSGACNAFRTAVMNGTLPSCLGRYDPATQTATTGPGQQCTLDPATPYPKLTGHGEPYIL